MRTIYNIVNALFSFSVGLIFFAIGFLSTVTWVKLVFFFLATVYFWKMMKRSELPKEGKQ